MCWFDLLRPTNLDPALKTDSRADLLQQLQPYEQVMLVPTSSQSLLSFLAEGFHLQIIYLFIFFYLVTEPTAFNC